MSPATPGKPQRGARGGDETWTLAGTVKNDGTASPVSTVYSGSYPKDGQSEFAPCSQEIPWTPALKSRLWALLSSDTTAVATPSVEYTDTPEGHCEVSTAAM